MYAGQPCRQYSFICAHSSSAFWASAMSSRRCVLAGSVVIVCIAKLSTSPISIPVRKPPSDRRWLRSGLAASARRPKTDGGPPVVTKWHTIGGLPLENRQWTTSGIQRHATNGLPLRSRQRTTSGKPAAYHQWPAAPWPTADHQWVPSAYHQWSAAKKQTADHQR